jgi:hypothetical protein
VRCSGTGFGTRQINLASVVRRAGWKPGGRWPEIAILVKVTRAGGRRQFHSDLGQSAGSFARDTLWPDGENRVQKFRASFYKDLQNSDGQVFRCLERQFDFTAENIAKALRIAEETLAISDIEIDAVEVSSNIPTTP